MKKFIAAMRVEYIKIRKSKIVLITCIFFAFIGMMMGLMLFVSKNPETAEKLGMIGTKAKMFGENDWPGYLALILQLVAVIGIIGFGFATSWIYGNEHISRTFKDIIALPVPRSSIVFAKLMVTFLWCLVLAGILYLISMLMGMIVEIPGWTKELFTVFTLKYLKIVLLTLFLITPVAWLAGYSRGIIAPLGLVIVMVLMAQFTGLLGWGPYFPWAIPGLLSVDSSEPGFQLKIASYIILLITSLTGYWGTDYWWRKADHH